jgi:hypothetical protein
VPVHGHTHNDYMHRHNCCGSQLCQQSAVDETQTPTQLPNTNPTQDALSPVTGPHLRLGRYTHILLLCSKQTTCSPKQTCILYKGGQAAAHRLLNHCRSRCCCQLKTARRGPAILTRNNPTDAGVQRAAQDAGSGSSSCRVSPASTATCTAQHGTSNQCWSASTALLGSQPTLPFLSRTLKTLLLL